MSVFLVKGRGIEEGGKTWEKIPPPPSLNPHGLPATHSDGGKVVRDEREGLAGGSNQPESPLRET